MNEPSDLVTILDSLGDDEFFETCFLANRPCLIRGGADAWPAVERWQEDSYLKRLAGSREVAVTESQRDDLGFNHQSPIRTVVLQEFLDSYQDNRRFYINDSNIPSIMVQDLRKPPIFSGFDRLENFHKRTGWFFGSGDQLAPLHYDDEENIYVVISGTKQFTLFDTASFNNLYPHDDVYLPDFSKTSLQDYNALDCPLIADTPQQTLLLEAGDILYVPGYWWHEVASNGRNLALSWVRTDRRSQSMALDKLLTAGVFSIDQSSAEFARQLLHEKNAADPRAVQQALLTMETPDQVIKALAMTINAFALKLESGDVAPYETSFREVDNQVCQSLQNIEGAVSYPELYLLQNFFRTGTGIFKDHGLKAA